MPPSPAADDPENEPGGPGAIGGTPVGLFETISLIVYLVVLGAVTVNVLLTVWPDQDPPCPPTAAVASGAGEQDGEARAPGADTGGMTGTNPARGDGAAAGAAAGGPDAGVKSKAAPGGAATTPPEQGKQRTCRSTRLFGVPVVLSSETLLVLLVMASGMLGSLVHCLRSLIWYVGNRFLYKSWTIQYLLQPIVGALMALLFYVIVRGGLFTWNGGSGNGGTGSSAVNGFGFAAIAAVIGMFSPQAAIKLKQVAETLFTPPASGRESLPQGNGRRPSVEVATLAPQEGPAAGGTEVVITGHDFTPPVTVQFGDSAATAVKVEGPTSIRATTPPHGTGAVRVTVTVNGAAVSLKDPFVYK